jgi:trk system potassium uptake protein TrkA
MYIIVAGGGKVGYHLTKALLGQGHEVVLIEMNRQRAQRIGDEFGSVVIPQRADEGRWLIEAGVERADVVIAATGDDEPNLIICQLAELLARRKNHTLRTIARVNHPKNEPVLKRLGVDATVSTTSVMLGLIEEELSPHPAVHLMTLRRAGIELMEFVISAHSPAVGKALGALQLPAGVTIPLVVRGKETLRPDDSLVFRAEDSVIALLPIDQEPEVRERLMGETE